MRKGMFKIQHKETIYRCIYDDFRIRLCEGEFPKGTSMPSLPDLCKQYRVGKNTMIKVLSMLRESGLIATSPGKVGQVLFDYNELDKYLLALPGLICDEKILADYYKAIRILFPTLYTAIALSCSTKQRAEINTFCIGFSACAIDGEHCARLSIRLFQAVLAASKNQLIRKIVAITMRKTVLPSALLCGHNEAFRPILQNIAAISVRLNAALQAQNANALQNCWQQLLDVYPQALEKALECDILSRVNPKPVANLFENMDDEKCFLVASDLRNKILNGTYMVGDFLPPMSEAKTRFAVSVSTLRKAYHILGEMGYTQTSNGRGTEVLSYDGFKNSAFLERVAMEHKKKYDEAVEFFSLTCGAVVGAADAIDFAQLQHDIDSRWNPAHRYSVGILLYHLFKGVHSPAVLSIYQVSSSSLYWGSYLKNIPATGALCAKNHQKCLDTMAALRQKNEPAAIALLQTLIATLQPADIAM
ncbi:MAG: GntR family transcriptional regulator [Ruthenibacterium sp.]